MSTKTPGDFEETTNDEPSFCGGNARESAKPVTAEQLSSVAFFRGIGLEHLRQIARYSKRSHFAAGQTIARQGEIANCFYVVRSGRVSIECNAGGRAVPLQDIGEGEPIGFSWFFNPDNLHFSARAIEPVEAIFFYGTLLREECEIDHELGYELMHRTGLVMMQRLEALASLLSKALAEKSSQTQP